MLTKQQVHQICRRLKKNFRKESYRRIADDYGVSCVAIFQIRTGRIHRDISDKYFTEEFRTCRKRKTTCNVVSDMKTLAKDFGYYKKWHYSGKEIAKILGVSKHMVYDILGERSYKDCE